MPPCSSLQLPAAPSAPPGSRPRPPSLVEAPCSSASSSTPKPEPSPTCSPTCRVARGVQIDAVFEWHDRDLSLIRERGIDLVDHRRGGLSRWAAEGYPLVGTPLA